jgi:hypothetical protein
MTSNFCALLYPDNLTMSQRLQNARLTKTQSEHKPLNSNSILLRLISLRGAFNVRPAIPISRAICSNSCLARRVRPRSALSDDTQTTRATKHGLWN